MEFLKRLSIASVIYITFILVVEKTGVSFSSTKFQVIALIYFWSVVFFLLHPYMFFIGLTETFFAAAAENNATGVVWKFLGILLAIVGTTCWLVW